MKWISQKINKIYHFFGIIPTFCFVVIFIVMGIIVIDVYIHPCRQGLQLQSLLVAPPPAPWYQDISRSMGELGTGVLLIAFFVSLIYIILGFIKRFIFHSKKNEGASINTLLLRGATGMILTVFFFFALSLELSFFGLCL